MTETGRINNSRGPADWRTLDKFALVLTLSGAARFRDELGHDVEVKRGDVLLLVPGVSHFYGPLPGHTWNEFYVIFEGPVFDVWRQAELISPQQPLYHAENLPEWIAHFERVESLDIHRTIEQVCRLQLLLASLLERRDVKDEDGDVAKVRKACALLEKNRDVPLHHVAKRLGLSYETFRKRFTAIMGIPPAKYRAARLMDQACERMRRGSQSDKAIAAELGFCDEFHFSHRFKAIVGCTPRQFRQRSSRPGAQL